MNVLCIYLLSQKEWDLIRVQTARYRAASAGGAGSSELCWRYTEHQRAYGAPSLSGSLPTDCFFGVFFSFVLFLILEAVFFFVWLISLH